MHFALRNTAQTFQGCIDNITSDCELVSRYTSYLLITSSKLNIHIEHPSLMFWQFSDIVTIDRMDNCELDKKGSMSLGNQINGECTESNSHNVQS